MPGGDAAHACPRCGMTFPGHPKGLANHRRKQPPCPDIMGIRARLLQHEQNSLSIVNRGQDSCTGPHSGSLRRTFHSSKKQKREVATDIKPAETKDFNSETDSPTNGSDQLSVLSDPCDNGNGSDPVSHQPTQAVLCNDQVEQHAFPKRDVCLSNHHRFQLDLQNVINKQRVDLSLFDDIIDLLKRHSFGNKLNFSSLNLSKRDTFMKYLEKTFNTHALRPKDVTVDLVDGSQATVSVFDVEAGIKLLLSDPDLMQPENLASDLDIFTGKEITKSNRYGEIHTGKAWQRALNHHCPVGDESMPLGLVVFGDKSHFDTHGTLCTTPVSFTLSIFNQKARNNPKFWMPLAYLPDLCFERFVEEGEESTVTSLEDEHCCLSVALESVKRVHREGGFLSEVLGCKINIKIWIHYIIGDTQGNNKWVAHYTGNGELKMPYRDCMCSFAEMLNPDPRCVYIRPDDVQRCIRISNNAKLKKDKASAMKSMSKHNVDVAFLHKDVPLSNPIHSVYKMCPPETLHTTAEGITKYIFESFADKLVGSNARGKRMIVLMDCIHVRLHRQLARNSERDYPRGATVSGLMSKARIGAEQRRGNLFRMLCVIHTTAVKQPLSKILIENNITMRNISDFLKLYISMESWFHDNNLKEKVKQARPMIAHVIQSFSKMFPRGGQGWHLSKVHGLTKIQHYITEFGAAINFHGGRGEANHKWLVKDTGHNTQKRAAEFTSQCASQAYQRFVVGRAFANVERTKQRLYVAPEAATGLKRVRWAGEYTAQVSNIGVHQTATGRWTGTLKKMKNAP